MIFDGQKSCHKTALCCQNMYLVSYIKVSSSVTVVMASNKQQISGKNMLIKLTFSFTFVHLSSISSQKKCNGWIPLFQSMRGTIILNESILVGL